MIRIVLALLLWAGAAQAASVMDDRAVPYLSDANRAEYRRWLTINLPRAVAIAPDGAIGWFGGESRGLTIETAREKALASCTAKGANGCAIYAENLDVVWPALAQQTPPAPTAPLISTWNYVFAPDARFIWRGPQAARGAYVWGHGYGGTASDSRGSQPQSHVRPFNNAGYDVIRFDREPNADGDRTRAAGWLRDGLMELRRRGYRSIIVGGQSRGAWNSLQMLETPGLADVVIAISPAAHGQGASMNLTAQADDFRAMLSGTPPGRTRVAVVQFAGDTFMGDGDRRAALLREAAPKFGALLLIDRPAGFTSHYAGGNFAFGQRYGACLLRFATDPVPPPSC